MQQPVQPRFGQPPTGDVGMDEGQPQPPAVGIPTQQQPPAAAAFASPAAAAFASSFIPAVMQSPQSTMGVGQPMPPQQTEFGQSKKATKHKNDKKQMRKLDSMAVMFMGPDRCVGPNPDAGCYYKKPGQEYEACTTETINRGTCDFRKIKVPVYYAANNGENYAVYDTLNIGQQIVLQLAKARVRFSAAATILSLYTPKVTNRHFLPFDGAVLNGTEYTPGQTSVSLLHPPQHRWQLSAYPFFDIHKGFGVTGAPSELAEINNFFRTVLGNGKKKPESTLSIDIFANNASNIIAPDIYVGATDTSVRYTDAINDNTSTFYVNEPFYHKQASNAIVADALYINGRYQESQTQMYKAGWGLLFTAFSHLRNIYFLFVNYLKTPSKNAPEWGAATRTLDMLSTEEKNLILYLHVIYSWCGAHEGSHCADYSNPAIAKVFKQRIRKFEQDCDVVLYHWMVELLLQLHIEKTHNKTRRPHDVKTKLTQESLNSDMATSYAAYTTAIGRLQEGDRAVITVIGDMPALPQVQKITSPYRRVGTYYTSSSNQDVSRMMSLLTTGLSSPTEVQQMQSMLNDPTVIKEVQLFVQTKARERSQQQGVYFNVFTEHMSLGKFADKQIYAFFNILDDFYSEYDNADWWKLDMSAVRTMMAESVAARQTVDNRPVYADKEVSRSVYASNKQIIDASYQLLTTFKAKTSSAHDHFKQAIDAIYNQLREMRTESTLAKNTYTGGIQTSDLLRLFALMQYADLKVMLKRSHQKRVDILSPPTVVFPSEYRLGTIIPDIAMYKDSDIPSGVVCSWCATHALVYRLFFYETLYQLPSNRFIFETLHLISASIKSGDRTQTYNMQKPNADVWIGAVNALFDTTLVNALLRPDRNEKERYMIRRFYITMIVRFFIVLVKDMTNVVIPLLEAYLDTSKTWNAAQEFDNTFLVQILDRISQYISNSANTAIYVAADPNTVIRLPTHTMSLVYPSITI